MATGIPQAKRIQTARMDTRYSSTQKTNDIVLLYPDKKGASEILQTLAADVRPVWDGQGLNTHPSLNRLYYGDNFPILLSLLKENNIKGNVRLVYIDPPYATNSIFKSRAQNEAYSDVLGGFEYLEFLRERLIVLRELLADDGSIYVHLDENMAFYAKIIMDEIFGRENFRNWITRKKCNPKNYTRNAFGNIADFILFYTKTSNYVWHRPMESWTTERAHKEYQYIEPDTGRRYKKVPIHAPGIRNGETGKAWRGMSPPPGKHWQYLPSTLDDMDARGEIFWSQNGNPRRKVYLDESDGIPVQDIWLEFRDAHNQNIQVTGYPTEKNPDLIQLIIEASSNPGDLILDCFSGSGTTLEVASRLERKWIGIDNSLEAIRTTLARLSHGTKPMGDFVSEKNKSPVAPQQPQMLSLFDFPDNGTNVEIKEEKKPILNFSIWSEMSTFDQLQGVVTEWQSTIGLKEKTAREQRSEYKARSPRKNRIRPKTKTTKSKSKSYRR